MLSIEVSVCHCACQTFLFSTLTERRSENRSHQYDVFLGSQSRNEDAIQFVSSPELVALPISKRFTTLARVVKIEGHIQEGRFADCIWLNRISFVGLALTRICVYLQLKLSHSNTYFGDVMRDFFTARAETYRFGHSFNSKTAKR